MSKVKLPQSDVELLLTYFSVPVIELLNGVSNVFVLKELKNALTQFASLKVRANDNYGNREFFSRLKITLKNLYPQFKDDWEPMFVQISNNLRQQRWSKMHESSPKFFQLARGHNTLAIKEIVACAEPVLSTNEIEAEIKWHRHLEAMLSGIDIKNGNDISFQNDYKWCDQGIGDVVSLATAVLDQFRIDQPHIKKMFTKSDNAGCYQGNLSAEAIYNVCKERDIKLLRYDYNEPCCGKDQCDRESAVVKTILRSYVDSGNNLLTAEDIHKAMHYSFGAKDAKVAVAQISNDKTVVIGPKIKNISNYHSFEFGEKSMKMWRYFNIGEGIEQEYGNLKIQPSIELLLPYSKTDNSIKRNKSLKEKQKRSDRQLYSLRFCTEMNCTLSFESDAELEEHMLSGLHTVPKSLTSLDKVRNSFVHKMKITSQLNMPISSSSNSASVKDKPHCMNIFLLQGWALPVRSSFRFSNQQKELLHKYFIRGEESGNKMSPEQVHMQLRRELPPDQYVTSQQIRSLFSRFSNLKRKGKLVEPTTENNENSQVNDNKEVYGKNDDFNLAGDNEDDNKYEEDIANLAKEICLVWKVNDWVAVAYEKQWNIGYIVEVSITGIRVNCMINGQEKNTFRWPVTTEEINNQTDKIICLVNAPFLISGCGDYSLSEEDYNTVISLFLEKLTAAE
ncbi:uncharacterized protein LOC136088903 isoform X2 [Hydra vulgaris]